MAKVLVVDDEPLIALMLSDWLEEQGHEVIGPAFDAGQGDGMIRQQVIDAAILDVTLGNGDCYGLAEQLRDNGVPFAFATGHGPDGLRADFRDIERLAKPFDFEVLERVLENLLSKHGNSPSD